jgi:ribosomal-protein-alanine N-acetyltransferase
VKTLGVTTGLGPLADGFAAHEISADGLVGSPPQIEDLDELIGLFSNERVVAMLGGARSLVRVREILGVWQALWNERGFGPWILRRGPKREFVGYAGVAMASAGQPGEVQLLYALLPEVWGAGVATRAATFAIDSVFGRSDSSGIPDQLIAYTLTINSRSRRVIEKLGFLYEREIGYAGYPHAFYRLVRSEWIQVREPPSISVTL